jgi:hypothetical protein
MKSNPWYWQYIIIYEQSNEFNSICNLSSDIVDEIIKKDNFFNNGFENMCVTDEIQNLSLLFDLYLNLKQFINTFFYYGKYDQKITQKWSMSWKTYSLI